MINQFKKRKGIAIFIKVRNPILIIHVRCLFAKEGKMVADEYTGKNGGLYFEDAAIEEIQLVHPIYSNVATIIKDSLNTNNYFEVT